MKYQDINTILHQTNLDPRVIKVIQYLHAENVGLKQELNHMAKFCDKMMDQVNTIATVAGLHKQLFDGLAAGKSVSDTISELRSEHLSDIASEEIKH